MPQHLGPVTQASLLMSQCHSAGNMYTNVFNECNYIPIYPIHISCSPIILGSMATHLIVTLISNKDICFIDSSFFLNCLCLNYFRGGRKYNLIVSRAFLFFNKIFLKLIFSTSLRKEWSTLGRILDKLGLNFYLKTPYN